MSIPQLKNSVQKLLKCLFNTVQSDHKRNVRMNKGKFLGHVALDFPEQKVMKTIPILP